MKHSFDIEIAKEYGIKPAILLENINYWIEKNKANCVHFYDGKYWTYNSKSAFAKLFPYMNARQIGYAIKKLIENGLIITGNFNEQRYDRTLWYAITKKGYSILQNCEMEETKFVNAINKNVKPIPNINTNINTNNNEKIDKKEKHKYGEYKNVLLTDEELEKLKDRFFDWEEKISQLDEGIELKGYKYKSHYLAILKWASNERPKKESKDTFLETLRKVAEENG